VSWWFVVFTTIIGCTVSLSSEYPRSPYGFSKIGKAAIEEMSNLATFRIRGPLSFRVTKNIVLSSGQYGEVLADYVEPLTTEVGPLAIIVHGNHSRKEAHRYQAEKLASWGICTLILQVPNHRRWLKNGKQIAMIIRSIYSNPERISDYIDPSKIIGIGHSFGGSAVTLSAALGAPFTGAILLDPAIVAKRMTKYLAKVSIPTILIGADRRVFRSKKRHYFGQYLNGEFLEVSVKGATHDDAQSPSMFAISAMGIDPFTEEKRQRHFESAILASAISILHSDSLSLAKSMFKQGVASGVFKDLKTKTIGHNP
jgi:pimeloyl-ACP methyl ester carboxylesterase